MLPTKFNFKVSTLASKSYIKLNVLLQKIEIIYKREPRKDKANRKCIRNKQRSYNSRINME